MNAYDNGKRLVLSIVWVIAGAILLTLSVTEVLDGTIWGGMGGALMAVGGLQLARHVRYARDPSFRETIDIEEHDEHNDYIRMRSWTFTGPVVVGIEACGMVVALAAFGNETVVAVLSCCICLTCLTHWLSYRIMLRKY